MRLTLVFPAIVALLAGPAEAEQGDVWRIYPVEGGGGSLAALAASEVDSPEPYWRFVLTCITGEPWNATVAGVDPAVLGAAIAGGGEVTVAVVADGNPDKTPLSGYFPEIRFGEMFGEWEYSFPFDLVTLDDLGAAKSLAVAGTGVDFPLPAAGTAEALSEFKALCATLPPPEG